MNKIPRKFTAEIIFLLSVYFFSLLFRLLPRLTVNPHLLTFEADIWYRLCLAQYVLDWGHLPLWDIRYSSYGQVPFWYNPLAVYFLAGLSKITSLDLPTVCSRIMPFIEALTILPFYWLCKRLYNSRVAVAATVFLGLTPSFIYWTGISTPQSFSLFALPLILLLWVSFIKNQFVLGNKGVHWLALGLLLALNFLLHLSYFNVIVILLIVHFALVRAGIARGKQFVYLLAAILFSQIITSWWWLPRNLYWWWTQAISTSSACFDAKLFLKHYGASSAILGHIAFLFVAVVAVRAKNKASLYFVPLYWAVFLLIETHMEWFLHLMRKPDLVWQTFVRPIEGFRFYSFLAQPLAICFGIMLDRIIESRLLIKVSAEIKGRIFSLVLAIVGIALFSNMFIHFDLIGRFHKAVVSIEDVRAAHWLRKNLKGDDKILADYHSAQMFSGIMGGKALLGSMFPLKKKVLPFIGEGYRVLFDIYSVYTTDDVFEVRKVLKRYQCTHVYLSKNTLRLLEFAVNGFGDVEGLARGDFDNLLTRDFSKTLLNPDYFKIVYEKDDIRVLELLKK